MLNYPHNEEVLPKIHTQFLLLHFKTIVHNPVFYGLSQTSDYYQHPF